MNIIELCPRENHQEDTNLTPLKVNYQLKPVEKVNLKLKTIETLTLLVKKVKSSRLFAVWYAFLPKAAISPYKLSLFDLLSHPDYNIRLSTLNLINIYFAHSSTYLLLANFHCRVTSFTPVCYHFAVSLGQVVLKVSDCFELPQKHPSASTAVSKAMITLLEQVPFHRLQTGLLNSVCQILLRLKIQANPVIQIAVMQVCLALLSIDSKANLEIKRNFDPLFKLFALRAFPNPVPGLECQMAVLDLDRNISYFAVQCLGKLALLDKGQFMDHMEDFPLLWGAEFVLKTELDNSLCLHFLRLLRCIGCAGSSIAERNPDESDSLPPEQMIKFWREILKPNIFDYVERRENTNLKSALCDCLSEIGESVFSILPQDRRLLCQTYLLTKCRIVDPTPENRIITSAQVRAIGRMMLWPSCYSDSAFVTDSAEILLQVLKGDLESNASSLKCIALSGTWSLANLAGVLAMQFSNASVLTDDDEFLSGLSANNDQLDFPPHLTVELASVAIRYAQVKNNWMNIRTNSVRALGSFVRCLDGIYTDVPGMADNEEFIEVCSKLISTITMNVESGKAMKIRWNACYAAAQCIRPLTLFRNKHLIEKRTELIDNLILLLVDFPNYKVRTSAAFALSCAASKDIFNGRLCDICMRVVRALDDSTYDTQEEGEGQHRADSIDQLCLTFCQLLLLADVSDLQEINSALVDHSPETLVRSLNTVVFRISPSKGSAIAKTVSRMKDLSSKANMKGQQDLLNIFCNLDSCLKDPLEYGDPGLF